MVGRKCINQKYTRKNKKMASSELTEVRKQPAHTLSVKIVSKTDRQIGHEGNENSL